LAVIWEFSDCDKDGKLNRFEFRIAMHLIYWCITGNKLPPSLPLSIQNQAFDNASTTSNPPINSSVQPIKSTNPNAPTFTPDGFVPAPARNNFDQSRLVHQYALPTASFEMRANLESELHGALQKRQK